MTQLLADMRDGREGAFNELFVFVRADLRKVAANRIQPADTLQPTELVNEAYLRLLKKADPGWGNRAHFFAIAARAMRDILVERRRKHQAYKRKSPGTRVPISGISVSADSPPIDILVLDEALTRLDAADCVACNTVIMRVFGGLTGDEIAAVLGVSPSTVDRKWKYAKAYLHRELNGTNRLHATE